MVNRHAEALSLERIENFQVQHFVWTQAKVIFDCSRPMPFLSIAVPGGSNRIALLRSAYLIEIEDLQRLMSEWCNVRLRRPKRSIAFHE